MTAEISEAAARARHAAQLLVTTTEQVRNSALEAIARALKGSRDRIEAANAEDLQAAEAMVANGELEQPLVRRLNISGGKFAGTVEMVRSVAGQPDPLGMTQAATELADSLELYRVSVPIGVLGVIFESRPDALVQIVSLCLKSGNAVLLKGGKEALRTNQALAEVITTATAGIAGIPDGWMTLLETREDVRALLDQDESVDLIIPRGGNDFVRYIMDNTRIPVMGHADGVCHVYVDRAADLDKAVRVVVDSKTQYVAVCNAVETLLVHQEIAETFLSTVYEALSAKGVQIRGDERTRGLISGNVAVATDADWGHEYLDLVLAVRIVDTLEDAVDHINHYGSHHTDAIVTEDGVAAGRFMGAVDSASVAHNASTRFADGFRYGLGAEVGISTNRLHSRGPVGLEGLTIYKFMLIGDGHTVDDFEGNQPRDYVHRPLGKNWKSNIQAGENK